MWFILVWFLLTLNIYNQLWFILCLIFIDFKSVQSIVIYPLFDFIDFKSLQSIVIYPLFDCYWLQIFTVNCDLSFVWFLLTWYVSNQFWFILCMYVWFFWTSNVNHEFRLILCLVFVIIKSYPHLSHDWSFIQRRLLSPDCFVAVWYKYAQ